LGVWEGKRGEGFKNIKRRSGNDDGLWEGRDY